MGKMTKVRNLKATIDKNRKGFAFLVFDDEKIEDVFIPPREADGFFHGDRVLASIGHSNEIFDIKVLEHSFTELVGRYEVDLRASHRQRGGWLIYERKSAREEIYIPGGGPEDLRTGSWVRVSLQFHDRGFYKVTGKITEIYGEELPSTADIQVVASEHRLIEHHSKKSQEEATGLTLDLDEELQQGRSDLRNIPFITIDGETARDFDDAVFVERSKSGHNLWVGIADVSHYVKENGIIDQEAYERATSVYFPERAFHMLPRPLSENMCSLRPNEPRLALVAKLTYDYSGKRKSTALYKAIIQSCRRATYTEIESEWKKNRKNKEWEYYPHFELYKKLRDARSRRGSIDFDLPEAEVHCTPEGEPISISNRVRFDSHRLIEEFMIAANEAVTEWIMQKKLPFVYRIHEEPSEEALDKFQTLAKRTGFGLKLTTENLQEVLSDFVKRIENHPAKDLLNMALLRSMKQAIYSAQHAGHFGLASQAYTHFTSPIRRYPDLMVHRLLKRALQREKDGTSIDKHERKRLDAYLNKAAEHCSYRERLAADAERQSIKMKQVRLMMRYLGDEFEAKVIGMIERGLFVQIEEPYVEGFICRESMADDFYQFNQERMIFVGKRKKRIFKIGQKVSIRVVKADIATRQIDFALISCI